MIILLSGSRNWDRPDVVANEMTARAERALAADDHQLVVRHGAAYPRSIRGVMPNESADWLAHLWCESEAGHWDNRGLAVVEDPWPADWCHCAATCPPKHMRRHPSGALYCPTAGRRRNTAMGETDPRPDELLALWRDRSSGTAHMIREAKRLGIPDAVIDYADATGVKS